MKKSYVNWNRESVEDTIIIKQLHVLSKGKINLPKETELETIAVAKKTFVRKKKNNKHRNKRY